MADLREAERDLADAVVLWRLPGTASAVVIDAATQALVDGLDSPALRQLAGEPAGASWFDLAPLVERVVEELGLADLLTASPERAALTVMVRRFRAGALSAHDLVCWAHQNIGHEGPPDCLPFVELDDEYDLVECGVLDGEQVERRVAETAEAFLTGRPSPGRGGGHGVG